MSYLSLKKYGYKHPTQLKDEVDRRRNSPATLTLNFDKNQYFLVLIPEIVNKLEEILLTERLTIPTLVDSLPSHASDYAKTAMLIREICSTHEIEGVASTRREIEESTVSATKIPQRKRFSEFFTVLSELFSGVEPPMITSLKDIRHVYDRVTSGGLEDNTELDGELFRKDPVYIRSSQQKLLHTGFHPESAINAGLNAMLAEVKDPTTTRLYSALLCHFMFETVHPFYDGNGRTGRVLLAYQLQPLLHELTILSLSQAISQSKNLYYNALHEARDERNHGELTAFILQMLNFIVEAQDLVIDNLNYAKELINELANALDSLSFHEPSLTDSAELYRNILLQLGKHYIFGSDLGLKLPELSAYLPRRLSEKTLRKYCQQLQDAGFLSVTTKRPLRFIISEGGAQKLKISTRLYQ